MRIRKMTQHDYEELYSLWKSCTGMGLNDLDDSREGIDRFLRRNPETCFVATDGAKITGSIMAGNDGRRGYIYHTATAPEYRKQGIAAQLLETVMQALKNCEIHKVALVVYEQNEAGNAFWEQAGFLAREDLVYRNKAITEMVRINT